VLALSEAYRSPHFRSVRSDTLDLKRLTQAIQGSDCVFHLAANTEVRFDARLRHKDLEQNTITMSNVLEAMRAAGVQRIAFASTSSIYGEPGVFPTPEDARLPV